jgi:hypothetical protein
MKVEFEFDIGDVVKLAGAETSGKVKSVQWDGRQITCQVRFDDGRSLSVMEARLRKVSGRELRTRRQVLGNR